MVPVDTGVLAAAGVALLSTFFFAVSYSLVRAGIDDRSPLAATVLTLCVNVAILWPVALAFSRLEVDLWAWRYFVLAGILAPAGGRLLNYTGIERVGLNISNPIVQSFPVISVLVAIVFLGEALTAPGLVGAAVVIGGGVVLSSDWSFSEFDFERRDLAFPVSAAVLYGLSHAVRDVAIEMVDSPVVAAAVTSTTSLIVVVSYVGLARPAIALGRRETSLFVLAGLASSAAIPLIYLAYRIGTLVVVSPLLNVSPLFVLALSYLFFHEEEPFTPQVIVGTGLVVAGIVILSLFGSV